MFFAFSLRCFLHLLSFVCSFHSLCLFAFSLRCSLVLFVFVTRSFRRCTAAAQVVGLFQKQRQPQNANKRDTRTPKTCNKKCKTRMQKKERIQNAKYLFEGFLVCGCAKFL